MEQGIRTMQLSDGKPMVLTELKKQQENYSEGSFEWADIQAKINQIIAQNFLEYVNR